MSKTKVLFAYCHELGRCLSIDEARTEFFSRKPAERKRFTFSCSDRNCDVTISGVNYHVKAEDGEKFKAAHFRSPHPHKFGCEWLEFTEDADQDRRPDESEADFTERKAKQKLTDYINCFDPSIDDPDGEPSDPVKLVTPVHTRKTVEDDDKTGENEEPRWSRYTRTNQLQRLIDTWQEAKETLPQDEFRALRLRIMHYGQVYLHEYITHIQRGLANPYSGVIYGGGTLMHRYGRGFLINFFDKHEGKPVRLYVSKNLMAKGRFGHYIDEILDTKNVRYFRIFLLNPVVSERENSTGKSVINLEISKLRQLAIYYELNSSREDESSSVETEGESPA
ncbi:hypothetical protein JJJ10_09900 [Klebsiella grimontii]|uniref:hypothetical protein n=1 Tax=Enterobacteriaceae TaxID=543 RepID=UPI000E34D2C4|nr:hypothetical protein [Klebsiella grimontii]RFP47799.1 hypothetical protein DDJ34_07995 [Klebsiella oxytoca]MBZ6976203.1 hypothetical protein [Klebsiella grimontii]MBZ7827820.1 hypothetical protein [Klebsiella grimontii]MDK7029873.1 hypothetical protein [Klebsiella grimontii]MDM4402486.1 hypothetical protein [Klebsiella grimontii]